MQFLSSDKEMRNSGLLIRKRLATAWCFVAAAAIIAWTAVCEPAQIVVVRSRVPVKEDGPHAQTVDFRYGPPEWQSAICLPDDPCKTLVDRSGDLLYHYGQGGASSQPASR